MCKTDKMFRIRFDALKAELDAYLESKLVREEKQVYIPKMSSPATDYSKRDGVQEKFLLGMPFSDDAFDEEEDASVADTVADVCKPLQADRGASHCRPMYASRSVCAARPELDAVLATKEETFSDMLLRLIDEKGLKDSVVYKNANIDRRLFSKIRGDEEYVPSKKTAISFCLALQLEAEEAKKLLATAGYTLSASSRFDLIIMYLIEHHEYNVHFANIILDEYGEGTLSR